MMKNRSAWALALAFLWTFLPAFSFAQEAPAAPEPEPIPWCTICDDDGLRTGACCQEVMPNIPQFPAKDISGAWACYDYCQPSVTEVGIWLGSPMLKENECDIYCIELRAGAGNPNLVCFAGNLYAKYSRTWVDIGPDGMSRQVWRFLVNGDVAFDTQSKDTCQMPPDIWETEWGTIHLVGYIDYFCCGDDFGASIVVSHAPGCIAHSEMSTRYLPPDHPAADNCRYYVLAGPGPFDFDINVATPQGVLAAEAVRPTDFTTSPHTCLSETELRDGTMDVLQHYCLCCDDGAPGWIDLNLVGCAYCPDSAQVFPFMAQPDRHPAMPTGMVGLKVGRFCDNDCYPWTQEVTLYWAAIWMDDVCGTWDDGDHLVVGVGTSHARGKLFSDGTVQCCFVDLQDALRIPDCLQQDFSVPFLGRVVWNLNPSCLD